MADGGAALEAALLATMLEALGRVGWGGPYLPELAAQKLFAMIPPWAFTPLLRVFGYYAKYYAFAGMIVIEVGGLTLLGLAARRCMRGREATEGGHRWVYAVAVAGSFGIVVLVVLLPALDAGLAGRALPAGPGVTVSAVAIVASAYAAILTRGVTP